MAAETRVITDCLDAVCRAGTALQLLEQIRDSTLPGTRLYLAADKATHDILDLIDELVELYAGEVPGARTQRLRRVPLDVFANDHLETHPSPQDAA